MNNSKVTIKRAAISCNLNEINIFSNNFITKISGENRILEKIANTVLQSEDVPKEFKNKIIKECGESCFKKVIEDGSYIWVGL